MRRDKEQALNPQECWVEIKRQWIPMRKWEGFIKGMPWEVEAEVDAERNIVCSTFNEESALFMDNEGNEHKFASYLLNSRPAGESKTWRELIETDICYQAENLPHLWKTEYQEATYE